MFLHEYVRRCPQCEEVTPHSRRRLALPKVVGIAALAGAAWCLSRDTEWWPLGGILIAGGVLVLLHDREKFWRVRCERCRGRKLRELRATKPTLDGQTVINDL